MNESKYQQLADLIRNWGEELGFQQLGITDVDLGQHEAHLNNWLAKEFHGEMSYMTAHGTKRSRPAELIASTQRVIAVRLNYLDMATDPKAIIASDTRAYVARYALGRDYHKLIRQRLVKLWQRIHNFLEEQGLGEFNGRVFTDSAPILEKALAEKAGLGWIGKNTLLLNREAGSWFFLGEIFTDIPLPVDDQIKDNHCGTCTSCMDVCPTEAIVAPYQLDARKCISYLTIEYRGVIDEALRPLMGNRIFGCDDCQVFCPWNKFAVATTETDFSPRHNLDTASLLDLFSWSEEDFDRRTQGSAIRRTGFDGWLRNISIALGNADYAEEILDALTQRREMASDMVKEHIDWAIDQQREKASQANLD